MSAILKEIQLKNIQSWGTKPSLKLLCLKSLLVLGNSKEKSRSQYTSIMTVWVRHQKDFKSWVLKKANIGIVASYTT